MNAMTLSGSTFGAVRPPALLGSSRRIATRREVVVPCQAVRERDFKLIADRTIDISTYGMLLPTTGPVTLGDAIIVSFAIPGMWIDAEATIARVIHGRRPSDEGPAIGVIFDVMSVSARAALAGYLHGRPPPLPRRGPLARTRRGESAPVLADQAVIQQMMASSIIEEADIEDVVEEPSAFVSDGNVDGLGVLREMALAWKALMAD